MVGLFWAEVVDLGMAASAAGHAAGVVRWRWTSRNHAIGTGGRVGGLGGTFPGGLFGVDLRGGGVVSMFAREREAEGADGGEEWFIVRRYCS